LFFNWLYYTVIQLWLKGINIKCSFYAYAESLFFIFPLKRILYKWTDDGIFNFFNKLRNLDMMLLPSSLSCEQLFFQFEAEEDSCHKSTMCSILICIHMWMNSQFLAGRTLLMLRSFFLYYWCCCCRCSPLTHSVEWCAWYNGNNVKLWTDWIFFKLFPFSQSFLGKFSCSLMFLTWQRCLDWDVDSEVSID
jgi:hypothetical protein